MSDNGWRVVYRLAVLALACYMTANASWAYVTLFLFALLIPVRMKKEPKPPHAHHDYDEPR